MESFVDKYKRLARGLSDDQKKRIDLLLSENNKEYNEANPYWSFEQVALDVEAEDPRIILGHLLNNLDDYISRNKPEYVFIDFI